MMDKEILDKYINLDKSCLTDREKTKVRDLLYEYKDTFSLRDEIVTCPNIEIEIIVTDKMPFLSDIMTQRKRTRILWTKK